MKKMFTILVLVNAFNLFADDPVCAKCQRIREYNAQHPGPKYEYYEDYLKAKAEGKVTDPEPLEHDTGKPISEKTTQQKTNKE